MSKSKNIKNQHVVPKDGDWAVKAEHSKRASGIYDTQKEAYDQAREIAKNNDGEVLLHGRDGTIRARETYGVDPNPPKDKEH